MADAWGDTDDVNWDDDWRETDAKPPVFYDDHTTGTVSAGRERILPEVPDAHRAYQVFVRQGGALQHKIDRKHPFSGCVFVGWSAEEIRARFTRHLLLEPICVYRSMQLEKYLEKLTLRAKGKGNNSPLPPLVDYQGEKLILPSNEALGEMVLDALGAEALAAEALGEAIKSVLKGLN